MRRIIIGEIGSREDYVFKTPIQKFQRAWELSKLRSGFSVYTNDPQFIEALEIFCGEENINIYFENANRTPVEISFHEAYRYVGDIYDIINSMRLHKNLDYEITDELVENKIRDYIIKYDKKY